LAQPEIDKKIMRQNMIYHMISAKQCLQSHCFSKKLL